MEVTSLFIALSLVGQAPPAVPTAPFNPTGQAYPPPAAAAPPPAGFAAGPYTPPPAGAATLAPPAVPSGILTAGSAPPPGAGDGVSRAAATMPARAASPPQTLSPAGGIPQAPGGTAGGGIPRTGLPAAVGGVPATAAAPPPEEKTPASELVREALNPPKSLGLAGRKTKLVEILSRLADRRRQIDAVRAYWRVAAETAEYHYAWQHVQFLKLLDETIRGIEQGPALQTAQAEIGARYASAQAREREQGLRLTGSQFDLADTAMIGGTGAAAPLSDDLPHVGSYHTYFDKVYQGRAAPSRIHLLNRSIPMRHEVIGVRADAVLALQDAYDAAFDAYRRRTLPLDEVLETLEALRTGRSEFMTAVRRYNEEIAEYALTSAPEGTSRETLVGMMVKNAHTPVPGKVSWLGRGEGIETVTFLDEFGTPIDGSSIQSAAGSAPVRSYNVQPVPDAAISGPAATPYNPSAISTATSAPAAHSNPIRTTIPASGTPTLAPTADPNGPSYATPPGYASPRSPMAPPPNALPSGPYAPPAGASSFAPPATSRLQPTLAPPLVSSNDSEVRPTSFDDGASSRTSPASAAPARFEPSPATRPLGATAEPATGPAISPNGSSIQFAPSQSASPATKANQPTLAPPLNPSQANPYRTNRVPLDGLNLEGANPMSSGLPVENRGQDASHSHQATPAGSTLPENAVTPENPDRPIITTTPPAHPAFSEGKLISHSRDLTTNQERPRVDFDVEPAAYYAQLQNASPSRRAQELVATLYSAKAPTDESIRPITLDECLAEATDRRRAVAAYWQAAEYSVRRKLAFQTLEQLEALQQTVLRFRDTPAGALAMLRVEAAKMAADAVRLESTIDWIVACGRLTEALHRPLTEAWLAAATTPHAGDYTATADKSTTVGSGARRAAERIPPLHEVLQLRATSVIAADVAVDFTVKEYAEGRGTINGVLHAVDRRRTETGDLSAVVTRYNLEIADYAFSLLPAETPRDTVVAALVVRDAPTRR